MTASTYELLAILVYLLLLSLIGFLSYHKQTSSTDFIIGNRSLNYWLTALAAHASDMSSWLFMAYPATILAAGLFSSWAAVGLIVFMLLNWQWIAPKIRVATEQYNSLTFSSFFESRLADTSGLIRLLTALMSLFFYTVYISAGLVGLGVLLETLFQIPYAVGVFIGIAVVVPYVFMGGYVTLAWIDLFQGFFLMAVIIFVPTYLLSHVGGWDGILQAASKQNLPLTLIPYDQPLSWWQVFFVTMGWGLGYFGQPHIITKFMGIRHVHEIHKSKYIGMTWMCIALSAATFVGLVGIAYFQGSLQNHEQVFTQMVQESFHPFLAGFMLCGVLAATINALSSQVLVLSSSLTEDFYKRIFRKEASPSELLIVSRVGILLVAFVAFIIAFGKVHSIYSLVLYAWSGLGASFGPLLLLSLHWKGLNKYGGWAGIISGGTLTALWDYINEWFPIQIPALIPGFTISLLLIIIVSKITCHGRGYGIRKET